MSPGPSKPPPPLLGFNNNVRHQGRVFHIQTEDSGIKKSRIVTHLFADGGRILRTSRTDYAEHVGREDMVRILRRVMKEQHKTMFIRLRSGELDELIEEACGPPPASKPPPRARTSQPPAAARDSSAPSSAIPLIRRERRLTNPALRRVAPSIAPPAADLDLDVDSLDQHPPGEPRGEDPSRAVALARTRRPPSAAESGATPSHPVAVDAQASESSRYAASRPAAIFGEIPTSQSSIFGQSTVSEQSLDEVILSYLADELDGSSQE